MDPTEKKARQRGGRTMRSFTLLAGLGCLMATGCKRDEPPEETEVDPQVDLFGGPVLPPGFWFPDDTGQAMDDDEDDGEPTGDTDVMPTDTDPGPTGDSWPDDTNDSLPTGVSPTDTSDSATGGTGGTGATDTDGGWVPMPTDTSDTSDSGMGPTGDTCDSSTTGDTGHTGDTSPTGQPGETDTGTCPELPDAACDATGHEVTLLSWTGSEGMMQPWAKAVYEICAPALGTCSNSMKYCNDHDDCGFGTCDRACAVDEFHDLSNFQVEFPELGDSCLPSHAMVTGTCSSGGMSVRPGPKARRGASFTLGDGSCHDPKEVTSTWVAKCDHTNLGPGDCLQMELSLYDPGQALILGVGSTVSKASTTCADLELPGPSCGDCPQ